MAPARKQAQISVTEWNTENTFTYDHLITSRKQLFKSMGNRQTIYKGGWKNCLSVGKTDDRSRKRDNSQIGYIYTCIHTCLFYSTHKSKCSVGQKSKCKIKNYKTTIRKYKRITKTWRKRRPLKKNVTENQEPLKGQQELTNLAI